MSIKVKELSSNQLVAITMMIVLMLGFSWKLSAAEFGLGDIPLDPKIYQQHLKVFSKEAYEILPVFYDARNEGIVTSAKDQGACGSCWAFASVGALESHFLKKWGVGPTDLSEQQQVVCNTSMWGCVGGNSMALLFWQTKGPITEICFPYTASDETPCNYSCEEMVTRVADWYTVPVSVTDFKTSLYVDGPSYWRLDVYSDFKTFWNTGYPGQVYVNQGGLLSGGHAVLLIGWDDGKGALLCKNSWGETGGPNNDGTFWIAYTGHTHNLNFGMTNFDLINEPVGEVLPLPDIKANNMDGPVFVSDSEMLSITIEMDAGDYAGIDADWWVLADTPFGWHYFDLSHGWQPGQAVTYQANLFDLSSYEVLKTSGGLQAGDYTFYFGVDMDMNGAIDMDQIFYDFVDVEIIP